jgi:Na+/proline symporter
MEYNLKFRCPSCNNFVAFWAIKQGTACPSCDVKLESNVQTAFRKSIIAGVLITIVTVIVLGAGTGKWDYALIFGPELGALLGFIVATVILHHSLSLWVASPKKRRSNNRLVRTPRTARRVS